MKDEASLKEKEDQCSVLSDELVKLEEASSVATRLVKEKRDRFQAISAGLSASDSGEEKTLAEQLSGIIFCGFFVCVLKLETVSFHQGVRMISVWLRRRCSKQK